MYCTSFKYGSTISVQLFCRSGHDTASSARIKPVDQRNTTEMMSEEVSGKEERIELELHKTIRVLREKRNEKRARNSMIILTRITTEDPKKDKKTSSVFPVEDNIYLCHDFLLFREFLARFQATKFLSPFFAQRVDNLVITLISK